MPQTPSARPATARSVVLAAAVPFRADGDALPKRIKILAWGDNVGRTKNATIKVGDLTAQVLSAAQEVTANDRVCLDFEHNSVPKHPNFQPDPRKVAAHGTIECVPGDGVYLSALSYTTAGLEFADNYPDVSAEAFLDAAGNLIFVGSVALTQRGDVAGMEFSESVAASAAAPHPSPTGATDKTTTGATAKTMNPPDYRALLVKMLGLAPAEGETEVSDESIVAAVTASAEKPAPPPAAESVACSAAKPGETPNIVAINARIDQMERDSIIARAAAEGKSLPLSAADANAMAPDMLRRLVDGLPAGTVPTQPGAAAEKPAVTPVALSADQLAAAKALGLSEENYRKALA